MVETLTATERSKGMPYRAALGTDIRLTKRDGCTGIFACRAEPVEGELKVADLHVCNWLGGRLTPAMEGVSQPIGSAAIPQARSAAARTCWRATGKPRSTISTPRLAVS